MGVRLADKASAAASAAKIEKELMEMQIGGKTGDDKPRQAMHRLRVAKGGQEKKASRTEKGGRSAARQKKPRMPWPTRYHGQMLFSSMYDINALGESFKGASSGVVGSDVAKDLEQQLA